MKNSTTFFVPKKIKINNLLHVVIIPLNSFSHTLDCFNFDISSSTVRFGGGDGERRKERNPNSSSPKSCVVGFKYGINHNGHQSKYGQIK
jgi:hypothetical protein